MLFSPGVGVWHLGRRLFALDPYTLQTVGSPMQIYDPRMGRPIHGVNELEWVDGELWGNVLPLYQGEASECIVRLNASDATVLGWIDARGLLARQRDTVRRQDEELSQAQGALGG